VEKNYKYNRLYSFKLGDKEPKKLTSENYHVTNFDISGDGKWVAFTHQPTPRVPDFTHADVKLLELSSGNIRELVTRPGSDTQPRFSPVGQWIAFSSSFGRDAWHGNSPIWLVKPDGSGLRNLSEPFDEEPEDAQWSADGKWIYYDAGQGVASRLFRIEVASGKWEALSDHDRGKTSGDWDLDAKGRFIVTTFEDPETPEEVYRLDLAAKKLDKLTSVNSDFVGVAPRTEVLRYKSFDGMEMKAWWRSRRTSPPGSATRCWLSSTAARPAFSRPPSRRAVVLIRFSRSPTRVTWCSCPTRAAAAATARSSARPTSKTGATATTRTSWPAWTSSSSKAWPMPTRWA
jgi:dipeptidyl aminopeptidase/acylaminoacyl peptidase